MHKVEILAWCGVRLKFDGELAEDRVVSRCNPRIRRGGIEMKTTRSWVHFLGSVEILALGGVELKDS